MINTLVPLTAGFAHLAYLAPYYSPNLFLRI